MAYASRAGRARTNARAPEAHAICDNCGFRYNLVDLQYLFDWRGNVLQNLRFKVCRKCLDTPQQNGNRPIITGPDPVPVYDPRPEAFAVDEYGPFLYLVTEDERPIVADGIGPLIVDAP